MIYICGIDENVLKYNVAYIYIIWHKDERHHSVTLNYVSIYVY